MAKRRFGAEIWSEEEYSYERTNHGNQQLNEKRTICDSKIINVVLLGETGVGKSTFVNAFINHLVNHSFEQAEENRIIPVIPASFITTVGFHFDEVKINIGDPDPNENFNEHGASVTQHCRSYIITLEENLHLRLIDTPGMGDTRGIEQDMKNIDHILSYVDQFSHLNAICFLLKPNVSRLNIFFRSCLRQLFTYLTPQAYENIMFCFTNTRSTFYAPGDTLPLLRRLLEEEQMNNITVSKKNTFCFDSESFRYLAARRQGVKFESSERVDFEMSWEKSAEESIRLLVFIEKRESYKLDKWRSLRRATLEIQTLVHPLLEQIRIIIYDIVLHRKGHKRRRIAIRTNSVDRKMCFECVKKEVQNVGPFSIVQYGSEQRIKTKSCACVLNEKNFLVESSVSYRYVCCVRQQNLADLEKKYNDYVQYYYQLSRFFDSNDPFRTMLEQFVEEKSIDEEVKSLLIKMKAKQDDQTERLSLQEIYEVINRVKSITGVEKHVNDIKKSRQIRMKKYERFVPNGIISNTELV